MDFDRLKLFKDIAHSRSFSKGAGAERHQPVRRQPVPAGSGGAIGRHAAGPRHPAADGYRSREALSRNVPRRACTGAMSFKWRSDVLKGEVEGTVRVASIYSVGLSEMSRLEAEFSRRYPQARLEVEYLRPEKVYEAVATDRADLGLMSYPEPTQRSHGASVAARRRWWWPLRRIILWPKNSEVQPEDLDGLDFVGFDEDLPIRRDIDRFLREHHVHVNVTLHFDNMQMIKEAVAHGSGVSIMPARVMEEEVAQGRLVPIRIAGFELFRPVGIVHRRKKRFHRAGQALLELLQAPASFTPSFYGA